jgi:hypothetical protein
MVPGVQVLKSRYVVALYSKYTRALTFENRCQKRPSIVSKETYATDV